MSLSSLWKNLGALFGWLKRPSKPRPAQNAGAATESYERLKAVVQDNDALLEDLDKLKATADSGLRVSWWSRRFLFGFGVAKAIEDWFDAFDRADPDTPLLSRIPRAETSTVAAKWAWFGFFGTLVGVLASLAVALVTAYFLIRQIDVLGDQASIARETSAREQLIQSTQALFDETCDKASPETKASDSARTSGHDTEVCRPASNIRSRSQAAIALITLYRTSNPPRSPDLRSARLDGVFLQEVDLRNALLREAHLSGADLREADLRQADLRGADMRGAFLQEVELEGADLRGAILQAVDLREARLQRVDLEGIDLQKADLREAELRGANLRNADLQGANLQGADLRDAVLRDAVLQGADLQGAILPGADLRGADLRGAILQGVNLRGADLRGANLQGADLRGADLQEADLRGADLQEANLQEAVLLGAILQGAQLGGAQLREADMRRADLQEADLSEVVGLTARQLIGADGDETTVLPEGITRSASWMKDDPTAGD